MNNYKKKIISSFLFLAIFCACSVSYPSDTHAWIEVRWSTWRAEITNNGSNPREIWIWRDCWESYQPNCPTDQQYSFTLNPGQTRIEGPGSTFCYEGQFDVGTQPGGFDISARRFQDNGANGECANPTATNVPTATFTPTSVPVVSATNTPTPTLIPTRPPSSTPTRTPSNTPTLIPTATPTPLPLSCTIDIPSSYSLTVGGSAQTVLPAISQTGGTISRITFNSSNSSSLGVCAEGSSTCTGSSYTDAVSPYRGGVAALQVSSSETLTAIATMSDGVTQCIDTASVNVANSPSWWQVTNGDVITNGSLQSLIPSSSFCSGSCTPLFSLSRDGNSEGIPSSKGGASFGSGSVSSSGRYAVNADFEGDIPPYTFSYFENLYSRVGTINTISGTTTNLSTASATPSGGYYYFRYTGASPGATLTLANASGINFGDRRVVLLVKNADVRIDSSVSLTKGRGFFALIAEKDIYVNPSIGGTSTNPGLSGIFATDGSFRTGTLGASQDTNVLYLRGSVKAGTTTAAGVPTGGVVLERDLTNNSNQPGESFEFAPDLLLSFPATLGESKIEWREVAP